MTGICWRCKQRYRKDWRNIFRIPGVSLCDQCRADFNRWWAQKAMEHDLRRQ